MHFLELASLHRTWLAGKQKVIAENLANASTPGYTAHTTEEFGQVLRNRTPAPWATHSAHLIPAAGPKAAAIMDGERSAASHSGNSVDVESQLLTAGEVRSAYTLNSSITKTFHRMILATTRS